MVLALYTLPCSICVKFQKNILNGLQITSHVGTMISNPKHTVPVQAINLFYTIDFNFDIVN